MMIGSFTVCQDVISNLEGGKSIRVQVLEINFIYSADSLSFKVLDFTSDLQTPKSIYFSTIIKNFQVN
jgi:hypothetical protein